MADPLRHRQTKGAATDMVDLTLPRHIPTLPSADPQDGVCAGPTERAELRYAWPNSGDIVIG